MSDTPSFNESASRIAEAFGIEDSQRVHRALADVMLDNSERLDAFTEFLELISVHKGDLSHILHKTHEPVGITEFLEDPYYMGGILEFLWPKVKEAVEEIINGGYLEALLMGAIGIAKTTIAAIINAYHLYLLSCEHYPQIRYGLMPTTELVFVMMNKNDTLAKDVTYTTFRDLIESIPYFQDHFMFDRGKEKKMVFPRGVEVMYSAANADRILGMAVMGGIVDEVNFMDRIKKSKRSVTGGEYDQAYEVYGKLVRRRKSRFESAGVVPGCLCVVSSKGYPGDFTEKRKEEVLADADNLAYIYEHAQWDILPEVKANGERRFSGKRFTIALGDERHNSVIITDISKVREGVQLLHPPIEFKKDFQKDMEGALRDFAGIATISSRPFFYNRDKVWGMAGLFEQAKLQSPFDILETDLMDGIPEAVNGYKVPYPEKYRAAHIDLALTGDTCGLAIGFVKDVLTSRMKDKVTDNTYLEDYPIVAYDVLLGIIPPSSGEIEFSEVRKLLYYLRDEIGIPIKWVTFDGFQSNDSRQILRKKGFRAGYISVEGEEAYTSLRTAIFNDRVLAPEHPLCFTELCALERDPKAKRIDHPVRGSKDISDAMAGVYENLYKKKGAWRENVVIESTGEGDEKEESKLVMFPPKASRRGTTVRRGVKRR